MAILKDIEKGAGEIIRVEVSEYQGKKYPNVRVWYTDKTSGEFKPTQKGVAIRPDQFDEFLSAINAARAELQ
ncbi:MAG TPA: transcriptional coactivator p15/PC4 family protein [Leptospiraceae bacterium]|nr:transcriptional coactivator p15/PC4 family protein [Leptospiraceae bacterium]